MANKGKEGEEGSAASAGRGVGKEPAASGGHPGPAGRGKFQGSKKGKRPIGVHLGREISISRVICAPGKLETPGESSHIPPHQHSAGWGWFFFFWQLKFGHRLCCRRKMKIPLSFMPPPQASQPSATELEQLGKGFLSWNRDFFGGLRPQHGWGTSGGLRANAAHTPGPSGLRSEPNEQERFRREKKYRQDGQWEGSLPHSSATMPECAMPRAGREKKIKIKRKKEIIMLIV